MDADLNTYLSRIEDAEKISIGGYERWNDLSAGEKIDQLIEWTSALEIAAEIHNQWHETCLDLDQDYLESLYAENDFAGIFKLIFTIVNKTAAAEYLSESYSDLIEYKFYERIF